MKASLVKVEEVMEYENAATAMISAYTADAVYFPCLSKTTPWLIKRGIDGQERIM